MLYCLLFMPLKQKNQWIVSIAGCFLLCTCEISARPEITLQSLNTPFAGSKYKTQTWTQMTASAVNSSKEEKTAAVEYSISDRSGRILFRTNIWLPGYSKAESNFAARLQEPEIKAVDQFGLHTGILFDPKSGQILHRMTDIPTMPIEKSARSFCIIDHNPDSPFPSFLTKIENELGQIDLTTLTSLPDRWYGYSMVDVIMLGWVKPPCRPSQYQALLDWAAQGGVLILFPSKPDTELLNETLVKSSGAAVTGCSMIDTFVLDFSNSRTAVPVSLASEAPFLDIISVNADICCTASGAPLLVRSRYGMGFIFVLAVPLKTLAHPDLSCMWQEIVKAVDSDPAVHANLFLNAETGEQFPVQSSISPDIDSAPSVAENILQNISGGKAVDRKTVTAWLWSFFICTALVGISMRFLRKGEYTWLIMIPAALLLSLSLYLYAETRSAEPMLSFIGVHSENDANRGFVQQAAAYYNPSETLTVNVSSGSETAYAYPLNRGSGISLEETEIATSSDAVTIPSFQAAGKTASAFFAAGAVDSPGLDSKLSFGAFGLKGTITNHTDKDFFDAVIFVRGRAYRLGSLPANTTSAVEVKIEDRLGEGEFIPKAVKGIEDITRETLIRQLTAQQQSYSEMPDTRPHLLAWSSGLLLDPGPDFNQVPAVGMSLFIKPLNIQPASAGEAITIPPEMLDVQFERDGKPVWSPKSGFLSSISENGGIILHISPPPEVGRTVQNELHLDIGIRAEGYRMSIYGIYNQSDKALIETFENPQGLKTSRIQDADRYAAPEGDIRILLRVESIEALSEERVKRPTWGFQSITCTLKGIVQ